jgi:hypothetical protein
MKSNKRLFIEEHCNTKTWGKDFEFDELEKELLEAIEKDGLGDMFSFAQWFADNEVEWYTDNDTWRMPDDYVKEGDQLIITYKHFTDNELIAEWKKDKP